MQTRTWPYGTTRKALIRQVDEKFIVAVDELGEWHMLWETDSDPCQRGDEGVLTFTDGGPMGGYWRFTKGQ